MATVCPAFQNVAVGQTIRPSTKMATSSSTGPAQTMPASVP